MTPATPANEADSIKAETTEHENSQQVAPHVDALQNMIYDDDEVEPELHWRTWLACAALFVLNYVQVFALTGPPAILSYIEADLTNGSSQGSWIPNSLSLVQAVGGPIIAFASDTFQARKILLVVPCTISFIGCAIAPGATSVWRVILAQTLIGVGFSVVPLAYSIPAEILPRRWRPLVLTGVQTAANLAGISAPLIMGGLTKQSAHEGWRRFYWIQMALWGFTVISILVGYRPPKRHPQVEHLSLMAKVKRLDIPGMLLLTTGLTVLLAGLNLGANPYPWSSARIIILLAVGCVFLVAFGVYEWKGTEIGICHHELFTEGRTFPLLLAIMFIEGLMLFSMIVFYPAMTTSLFTSDPILLAARQIPFQGLATLAGFVFGIWATKIRDVRMPLVAGFTIFVGGLAGLACVQPDRSVLAVVMDGVAGIGFGGPLILIITGVQLCTPPHLIATSTALTTTARAVSATVFTAIYSAAVTTRVSKFLPEYVANAAIANGLPTSSVASFISTLAAGKTAALSTIQGVTPSIIAAGVAALKQAYADSFRVVFMIAAPLGAVAIGLIFLLGGVASKMTYRVDAPVEDLHAKNNRRDVEVAPANTLEKSAN